MRFLYKYLMQISKDKNNKGEATSNLILCTKNLNLELLIRLKLCTGKIHCI